LRTKLYDNTIRVMSTCVAALISAPTSKTRSSHSMVCCSTSRALREDLKFCRPRFHFSANCQRSSATNSSGESSVSKSDSKSELKKTRRLMQIPCFQVRCAPGHRERLYHSFFLRAPLPQHSPKVQLSSNTAGPSVKRTF
jgi:hypothetical protein